MMKKHKYKFNLHCRDCWDKSIKRLSKPTDWSGFDGRVIVGPYCYKLLKKYGFGKYLIKDESPSKKGE